MVLEKYENVVYFTNISSKCTNFHLHIPHTMSFSVSNMLGLCFWVGVGVLGCTSTQPNATTEPTDLSHSSMLCQGDYFTPEEADSLHQAWKGSLNELSQWEARASRIKRGIFAGTQLTSFPERTSLHPIHHSKHEFDTYSVENVAIESLPGFFVAGNLYRPTQVKGKVPAILSPHGHWKEEGDYGRFRADKQMLCAHLAQMGAIVFAYDMIGYGDSDQVEHDHPQGLALQTWNSIRALDFLTSLPETDPDRLAVTGASGGGTQSFILTAIDPRIAVSVPVVQVSAHFFGGCSCESGMPIHKSEDHQTSNVEIAALAAPRPMLLVSDGEDWTRFTPQVEYPYIKHIYSLYGYQDRVENVHLAEEGHSYGENKRLAVYPFLAKHLSLDLTAIQNGQGEIMEEELPLLSRKELEVFNAVHLRPDHAIEGNEAVWALLQGNR